MKGLKRRRDDLDDSPLLVDEKEEAFKIVILLATSLSGICVLCLCLTVPSLLSRVYSMRNLTDTDLRYCRGATDAITTEIGDTIFFVRTKTHHNRTQRDEGGGYGGAGAVASNNLFQECPACCKPGPQGPPGDPGLPGLPGSAGSDGSDGRPGSTPNASCIPERVFEPPPCLPCPQGPRGVPGHPGFPGEPGDIGISGRPGYEGPLGNPGAPGSPGNDGPSGAPGPIGDKGPTPEGKLVPGVPGDSGDPGPWGIPGHPGQNGDDGPPGLYGEKGYPGPAGPPGDSGPIGPPGPAGEGGPPGTQGTCACQDTEVVVQDYKGNVPAVSNPGYNPQPPQPAYSAVVAPQPLPAYNGGGGVPSFNQFNLDANLQSLDTFQQVRRDLPQVNRVKEQSIMSKSVIAMATTPKMHESETGFTPADVKVLPEQEVDGTNGGQEMENGVYVSPITSLSVNDSNASTTTAGFSYPADSNSDNIPVNTNNNFNQSSYYKYGRN